jgi:hypothetical protein
VKFLADENVDRQIVERLRQEGHNVEYVAEIDSGITDDEVLQSPHPSVIPLCYIRLGTALALRSLSLLSGRQSSAPPRCSDSRQYRLSYHFSSSCFYFTENGCAGIHVE